MNRDLERRADLIARRAAKLICELRREGLVTAAAKIETAAMEAIRLLRAGVT